LKPSTTPLESGPSARNQLSQGARKSRNMRAKRFIVSSLERMVRVHHLSGNYQAQKGEGQVQKNWNSSFSRQARTERRLYRTNPARLTSPLSLRLPGCLSSSQRVMVSAGSYPLGLGFRLSWAQISSRALPKCAIMWKRSRSFYIVMLKGVAIVPFPLESRPPLIARNNVLITIDFFIVPPSMPSAISDYPFMEPEVWRWIADPGGKCAHLPRAAPRPRQTGLAALRETYPLRGANERTSARLADGRQPLRWWH